MCDSISEEDIASNLLNHICAKGDWKDQSLLVSQVRQINAKEESTPLWRKAAQLDSTSTGKLS